MMMQKTTLKARLFTKALLLVLTFFSMSAQAQLIGWDTTDLPGGNGLFGPSPWTPEVINTHITTSGLVRGSTIAVTGTAARATWGGSGGWSATSGTTTDNSSFHFTIIANEGYKMSLSSLSTATRRSNSGPTGYTLYYSVNGGPFTSAGTAETTAATGTTGTPNITSLTGIAALQNVVAGTVVKFRITPTGPNTTGTYYLTGGENALQVNGTVVPEGPVPPAAPVATAATAITTAGFTANWNAVAGATGYMLDVSTDMAFTTLLAGYNNISVTGTSHAVTMGILPDTTYYYRVRSVEGTQTSANSNTISAVIPACNVPVPTASTTPFVFCNSARASQLTATGTGLQWYADATGGTALTADAALSTRSYYVSQTLNGCESARIEVPVTVNITPVPTASTTPFVFCNSATASQLTATGIGLQWYTDATGGTALTADAALSTRSYYVSQTLNGCESARIEVPVTVNVTPVPAASTTPFVFCNSATASQLTATGTGLQWYTDATGGTALTADTALSTRSYYVSQTLNGCESARIEVPVTVNVTPVPTASTTPFVFCNSATASQLTATGTGLQWYSDATGGTALTADAALSTRSYYVSQTLNGCESARIEVPVTVTVLTVPIGEATQQFTAGETLADLAVTVNGNILIWYQDAALTIALPATTVLTDGTVYYAVQSSGECRSQALAVTADAVLGVTEYAKNSLTYYPNPVSSTLNISLQETIDTVTVYNVMGQAVQTQRLNANTSTIDMSGLAAGHYIVTVTAAGQAKTFKIVKQ
jgi:hypothetical protein